MSLRQVCTLAISDLMGVDESTFEALTRVEAFLGEDDKVDGDRRAEERADRALFFSTVRAG